MSCTTPSHSFVVTGLLALVLAQIVACSSTTSKSSSPDSASASGSGSGTTGAVGNDAGSGGNATANGSATTATGATGQAAVNVPTATGSSLPTTTLGSATLTGTWVSACHPVAGAQSYERDTRQFTATTGILTQVLYGDQNCTAVAFTLTTTIAMSAAQPVAAQPGVFTLIATVSAVTVTPNAPVEAASFNQTSQWGFSNWVVGQSHSVAGQGHNPTIGSQYARYYQINGNSLSFTGTLAGLSSSEVLVRQ